MPIFDVDHQATVQPTGRFICNERGVLLAEPQPIFVESVVVTGPDGTDYDLGPLTEATTIRQVKHRLAELSPMAAGSQQLFHMQDTRSQDDLSLGNKETLKEVCKYGTDSSAGHVLKLCAIPHAIQWVPRSEFKLYGAPGAKTFESVDNIHDPRYPEDLKSVGGDWVMKYYTVSYHNPTPADPLSLVAEFIEPVILSGLKIRGENYSNMQHMLKTLNLSAGASADGPWTIVASGLETSMDRGWHLWSAVELADAQALCDMARTSEIAGEAVEKIQLNTDDPSYELNRQVHARVASKWNYPSVPAQFYRLDFVAHNGSYAALAEIDFLR